MLADELDFVVGVDTHRDEHALALVASPSGARLAEALIGTDERGYAAALALAEERAPGRRAWAIEGSGSYGKGLARYLAGEGERVFEIDRPRRQGKHARAKTDRLDALRAARSLIAEERPALPRTGAGESLRVLLAVRSSAVSARKVALTQLRALLVTCPEPLRAELRTLSRARLLARCRSLLPAPSDERELAATMLALRLLADRIEALQAEEKLVDHEILTHTQQAAPQLLAERGIGPIGAAQLLVSWSHRGRLRSEAAFARLAGTPPIPASSGQTIRHRLDRGGDRKTEQRPPPNRRRTAQTRRRNDRLHRTPTLPRQDRPRSDPLPQALPRPPPLPADGGNRDNLTVIEASITQRGRGMLQRKI